MLYGYIFSWNGFDDSGGESHSSQFTDALDAARQFENITVKDSRLRKLKLENTPKWQVFLFKSHEPLLGMDDEVRIDEEYYRYKIFIRVNDVTKSVLFASQRYKVTEAAVSTFNMHTTPKLQRRIIDLRRLSEDLLNRRKSKAFSVTYYMADVPGYGAALRQVALIGEDVANTSFLADESHNFKARQIGVRPITNRNECARLGSNGSIQFKEDSMEDLERFLGYGYSLKWFID